MFFDRWDKGGGNSRHDMPTSYDDHTPRQIDSIPELSATPESHQKEQRLIAGGMAAGHWPGKDSHKELL